MVDISNSIFHIHAVHPLNELPYSKLDSKAIGIKNGVIFVTYSSLIASSERGRSRLQQLVQWCGHEFDGLLVFDEVMYDLKIWICSEKKEQTELNFLSFFAIA
jgi:hypothetical protein